MDESVFNEILESYLKATGTNKVHKQAQKCATSNQMQNEVNKKIALIEYESIKNA